jgi:hypothetical protein
MHPNLPLKQWTCLKKITPDQRLISRSDSEERKEGLWHRQQLTQAAFTSKGGEF